MNKPTAEIDRRIQFGLPENTELRIKKNGCLNCE